MSRKILLFLLGIFLLIETSSCSPAAGLEDFETHNGFNHFFAQADEIENQFYFIQDMTSWRKTRMMYLDKDAKEAFPLCGKAECTHNSGNSDCNAEIPGTASGMAADKETLLYMVCEEEKGEYSVYRMRSDGTHRRKVRTLTSADPAKDPDFPRGNRRIMFHRGHLYASGDKTILKDGEWECYNIIIDYDLSNEDPGHILYERPSDPDTYGGFQVRAVGSFLYYVRGEVLEPDDVNKAYMEIGRINIETGEREEIFADGCDFGFYEVFTDGNRFIFTSFADGRVMEYDDHEKRIRELMNFDTDGERFMTMYLTENRVIGFTFPEKDICHIEIRDFDGNILYDVKRKRAEFEYGGRTFCGMDDECFYCSYVYGGEDTAAKECLAVYPLDSDGYYIAWQD